MYEVESGIEIPASIAGRPRKYPFGDLEVNQSFFVPFDGKVERAVMNCLYTSASTYGRRNKKKFHIRRFPTGARCWRIK